MDPSSGAHLFKPASAMNERCPPKQSKLPETARLSSTENDNHDTTCNERSDSKKKGRPRVEVQELRNIPARMIVQWKEEFKSRSRVKCPRSGCWLEFPSIYGLKYHYQRCQGAAMAEKLNHGCPCCEAVFATKVRLQKHKLWNHPDRINLENKTTVNVEPKDEQKDKPKLQKNSVKGNSKKRLSENSHPWPVLIKVKKKQEVSQPSQNGECATQRRDKKQQCISQQHQGTPSDSGYNESEGNSLPTAFPEEDPERMKHRRKQKTPKKFTGEQPSISGTFGLKGMNKVEEKLKAGRSKRLDGIPFNEESQKKQPTLVSTRREPQSCSQVGSFESQKQDATEHSEGSYPTCSVETLKVTSAIKKHVEIDQKPLGSENVEKVERQEREKLRGVLRQMGRITCTIEGCSAQFSSLMGYQYHKKRCGKELLDTDKPVFLCRHCGKTYNTKVGRNYHVRTEHLINTAHTNMDPINEEMKSDSRKEKEQPKAEKVTVGTAQKKSPEKVKKKDKKNETIKEGDDKLLDLERTPSGRVRRRSAQVAVFHLQEIAEDELAKDWGTKRRIKDDLVPDIKRLNYTRPGLPSFNSETLETWKNEVKEKGFICCPNSTCDAIYSSLSGLKAHLASCIKGGGIVGKYTCLLCQKEFSSESGVKYHISKTHCQNWFRASGHIPNIKDKELQGSPPQKGMKNGVPSKKRGRKPKEHLLETTSIPEKILSSNIETVPTPPFINQQTPDPNTSLTPIRTSNQNPECTTSNNVAVPTDDVNVIQTRDLLPPVKKRAKSKKVQLKE